MAYLNQDLSDQEAGLDFPVLPKGAYIAQIIGSEIVYTNAGNMGLSLTWFVMAGQFAKSEIRDYIVLSGSDKGVAFGRKKLKTIAVAIGHPNPNRIENSEELHGMPCEISVSIQEYNGVDRNQVNNYKPISKTTPQQAPATPPIAPPVPPSPFQAVPPQPASPNPPPSPFQAVAPEDLPF